MASSRRLPLAYNESTYAANGADYSSLAVWEAATDIDLVTATAGEVLTCAEGIYDDTVVLAGATTNASYFRVVRGAKGTASPTSGVRFVKVVTAYTTLLSSTENYAQFHDLAVKVTTTTNSVQTIAFHTSTTTGNAFICCVAYDVSTTGAATPEKATGFYAYKVVSAYFINCVGINLSGSASSGDISSFLKNSAIGGNSTVYVYNCTFNNSNYYGCLAQTATGYTSTINLKNTVFENITSTILGADGLGTETYNETTNAKEAGVTFLADGYHLSSADTVAIGNGTDLSADGTYAFDDDIDGETRSDWDIGCDEYISTATLKLRCLMGCGQ